MMQQQPSGIAAALPPGQAPQGLPFNMPKSGSNAGIAPVTPRLEGMSPAQLNQLLQQVMQSQDPMVRGQILPIAGALSKAVEAEKLKEAVKNQGVMQQNAQQQQQPPVVQSLMAQAQQMQPQGIEQVLPQEPQRMATGGMVQRFADGPSPEGLQMDPMGSVYGSAVGEYPETEAETIAKILAKNPEDRSPSENLKLFLARKNEPGKPQARLPSTPTTPAATATPAPNAPQAAPTGIAAPRPAPRLAPAIQPTPAVQPVPGPTFSDTAGLAEIIENQKNELLKRKQTPEEVLAGRKGLDELMRKRIADEEAYAQKFGAEALAERDAALKETEGFTPRLLAAMAAGIRPEKGQVMGSLMGGFSRGIEQQAQEAKEAKKAYKQDQRLEQQLRSTVGQMQVLEAQRQQAIREKDYERASEIDDKISQLGIKLEEFKIARSDKAEEQRLKNEKAAIDREELEAKKPLYKAQAKYYSDKGDAAEGAGYRTIEAAERRFAAEPEVAVLKKELENPILTPAERQTKLQRLQAIRASIYSAFSLQVPGVAAGASGPQIDLSQWGEPKPK